MTRLWFPLLAALALVFVPVSARAQFDEERFRVGTHVLRNLMHARGLTPLTTWNDLWSDPEQSVLVILGDIDDVPPHLNGFVRDGGAVLFATDHQVASQTLQQLCGFNPEGHRVYSVDPNGTRDPDQALRNQPLLRKESLYLRSGEILPHCVVLQPTQRGGPDLFWNAPLGLRSDPLRVVTNRSGVLRRGNLFDIRNRVHVLAEFPAGCWYGDQVFVPPTTRPAFAVSTEVGKGRLLLLADHSVFSNEMLLQEDNDNLTFASQVVAWLRDENKRTKVLFVEDSEIQRRLQVSMRAREVTFDDLEADVVDVLNQQVKRFQEEDAKKDLINRELNSVLNHEVGRKVFGRDGPGSFQLVLLLVAAIGVVVYGVFRLMRASHPFETNVPLFEAISGRHRPVASPLVLQQRSALQADDLREFGRESAREWFASIPGCPVDETEPHPPRIEVRGGWWQQKRVRQEVLDLWNLARDGDVSPMSQQGFRRLLSRIERLQAAMDAGELRIMW